MSRLKNTYLGIFMLFFGFFIIAMTTIERAPDQPKNQQINPAQVTLEGTVVDSTTGEALSEVEVSIAELAETVSTDNDGVFVVENLAEGETYTLKIDHEGYEKHKEAVEATTMGSPILELTIELTPSEQKQL